MMNNKKAVTVKKQTQNQKNTQPNKTDIIVVGAGPAGLCFASALSGSGLSVKVIEKNPLENIQSPAYDGREIALTHPSAQRLKMLNIWSHIPKDGIYALKEAKVINGEKSQEIHFKLPTYPNFLSPLTNQPMNQTSVDRLGYLVSNHHIRRAAYIATNQCQDTSLLCGSAVTSVAIDGQSAQVKTADGHIHESSLLVVADSRFSQIRRFVGISADMHDMGHAALLFRVRHQKSNQSIAIEHFNFGRTLALLPLTENLTNCVITADSPSIERLKALTPEQLAEDTMEQLQGHLGHIELTGDTFHYPLIMVHAQRFFNKNAVLIGDAAVGMHPVTAHGFNLGLESAVNLAELIVNQQHVGTWHGQLVNEAMLFKYQQKHMLKTRPLYHGTNALVKLFTNDTPPARLMRDMVVFGSNKLTPIKAMITKQLTG